MIKLNPSVRGVRRFEPPVPVDQHAGDINGTADQQIQALLWIPALLVCRFLYQFPHLTNEADELFSVGMGKVVESVSCGKYEADKIGGVVHVKSRRAMEDYANNLTSVVKIATTTRYENYRNGIDMPTCHALSGTSTPDEFNDTTELIIQEAADALGVNLETMSLSEKRKLAEYVL